LFGFVDGGDSGYEVDVQRSDVGAKLLDAPQRLGMTSADLIFLRAKARRVSLM
jgi:hypothetical protein